jgi:hypothetical protein
MQDRYVGDVGDFGKYALLQALCGEHSPHPLRLGVNWYYVPNESHNDDGKHIGYLDGTDRNTQRYRICSPTLYDQLATLVLNQHRNLESLEEAEILPSRSLYFREALVYSSNQPRRERIQLREAWLRSALKKLESCDLVFMDPDNGLEAASVSRYGRLGPKYTPYDDLKPFVERGQSLVVYHHTSRQGTAEAQVARRIGVLREVVTHGRPVYALLFRRGSVRAYFVLPAPGLEELLLHRITTFIDSPWSQHFQRPIASASSLLE